MEVCCKCGSVVNPNGYYCPVCGSDMRRCGL